MSENTFDIQYRFFVIDERPLCVWDTDIRSRVLEFLENVDPTYFEYIADTHLQHIREDQPREKKSQHAALAIRMAYSQALETLFAFLCAAIQAPRSVHSWIDSYRPRELYSLVRKIHNRQSVMSQLNIPTISWLAIADTIFAWLVLDDKERESAVKKGFGQLWSRFASQFLDEGFSEEYNSIKHGFRVRPGGFYLAMGVQDQPGIAPPDEKMRLIGKSEFGSSYFASHKIGEAAHHLKTKYHHRNWSPEDLSWSLYLVALSIANIKAALKILNGVPATEVQFMLPKDDEVFCEPWKRSAQIGVTSMSGFRINIQPEFINPVSKDEILTRYKAGKDAGVRRIILAEKAASDSSKESAI